MPELIAATAVFVMLVIVIRIVVDAVRAAWARSRRPEAGL